MSGCIKTGCWVNFHQLGFRVYGDLHGIAGSLIISYNGGKDYTQLQPVHGLTLEVPVSRHTFEKPGVIVFDHADVDGASYQKVARSGGYIR